MSEELLQRDLINNCQKLGKWDFYNIGATSVKALKEHGIIRNVNYGAEEKKKVVVVNLSAPNLFKDSSSFLKVMHLYFNHENAGKKIAQNLNEILRELNFQIALK